MKCAARPAKNLLLRGTVVLAALAHAEATVTVQAPRSTDNFLPRNFTTATFVFYGPQGGFDVSADAIFVDGPEACIPSASTVAGKIVVSDYYASVCDYGETYGTLSRAGAVAYVLISPTNPPGAFTFRHHTWDACAFCDHDMPMVQIFSIEEGDSFWSELDLALTIGGEHNRSFEGLFVSLQWTLAVRVILPVFALYTAVLAIMGWIEYGKNMNLRPYRRTAQVMVFVIEAPCMIVVAVLAACGQMGPTQILPVVVHSLFADLLLIPSLVTTIIVAIYVHDKTKTVHDESLSSLDRSSIWGRHRVKLMFGTGVLTLGSVAPATTLLFVGDEWPSTMRFAFTAVVFPLNLFVGFHFMYKVSLPANTMPTKR